MALYLRLVAATCRPVGPAITGDQVVLAFWHEYNLAAATAAWRLRRHRHHISFSTQTARGEVMTTMLRALGSGSVPLPAEGQRAEATRLARTLARLGREGASPVVSPDGPLGPYRQAKPGALIVAREAGLEIQPWAVVARPSIRLSGRWDRHVVPLPFCRLRVIEGRRVVVAGRDRLRPKLAELQDELERISAAADARGG
jgi:lysophospholipid acyltransferase (LPLAT)-like uncharacterized protein